MNILAVETSTERASVCVLKDKNISSYVTTEGTYTHNKKLFGMIDSALKEAGLTVKDVDVFAVGSGPGSFTGLRVGVSAVKGMAIGMNKKILPVPSIDAVALNVLEDHPEEKTAEILLEGKQKDYFHARYSRNGGDVKKISEIIVLPYKENCYINGVCAGNVHSEFTGLDNYAGDYFPDARYVGKLCCERQDDASNDYEFEPEYYKDFKVK